MKKNHPRHQQAKKKLSKKLGPASEGLISGVVIGLSVLGALRELLASQQVIPSAKPGGKVGVSPQAADDLVLNPETGNYESIKNSNGKTDHQKDITGT